MAAFSSQHNPFLLESNFLQNPTTNPMNISGFIEDGSRHNNCLPQIYPPQPFYDTNFDVTVVEVSQLEQNSKIGCSDDEPSMNKKQSTGSSIVVDKIGSSKQETQKMISMEKKTKKIRTSSLSSAQSKDAKEGRNKKQKKSNDEEKEELNTRKANQKDEKKVTQEPPSGYIHVRARRGQATDSHSLAERARREIISKKMKILQGLVPGCDQVTGKALVLDEIINYVRSLQNQVEFLSMKLAYVNPLLSQLGVDLDTFMVMPERLSSIKSTIPSLQNCSPTMPTPLMDTITTTTATVAATIPTTNFGSENNYPIIDSFTSLLLEEQRPADFTQDTASLLWDLKEQMQEHHNPFWFSNNMGSFH